MPSPILPIRTTTAWKAFTILLQAKEMTSLFERNKHVIQPYPFATSRGHEALQISLGMELRSGDLVYPYYRDDALLLTLGVTPYQLMLQLLARDADPFSGGYIYYAHPSYRQEGKPYIPYQSSATGMQAIPAVGAALGLAYRHKQGLMTPPFRKDSLVICSLGDGSMTEGEVSESLQFASHRQLPILFAVQDNKWSISVKQEEYYNHSIHEIARGFGMDSAVIGMDRGGNFPKLYPQIKKIIANTRKQRKPFLLQVSVPLLTHHTSGVRMETYRDDLDDHRSFDPYLLLKKYLLAHKISASQINTLVTEIKKQIREDFKRAKDQPSPHARSLTKHVYAPTPSQKKSGNKNKEIGIRKPKGAEPILMIESIRNTMREVMEQCPESLFFGQDVGERLGGVFREALTLGKRFGRERVFNTGIQEALAVGITSGLSALGLKPIVEIPFADYLGPAINQLYCEVSRSHYLSRGKWPISMVLRVPCGSYQGGGPFHSGSMESMILRIPGIKVIYPSNGADYKGLFKTAFDDPNPVVVFEHKGLYWSKNPGTKEAKTPEPSSDYQIPLGKGRVVLSPEKSNSKIVTLVTYGMGVYWALEAAKQFSGQVEIIDLRSLEPLDFPLIEKSIKKSGRVLLLTEETPGGFIHGLAGKIAEICFETLQAPPMVISSEAVPAIPLNLNLEKAYLPSVEKVEAGIEKLLNYPRLS